MEKHITYIQVPVPEAHVLAVMQFLVQLSKDARTDTVDPPAEAKAGDWTREDLVRLAAEETKTTRTIAQVMDALALSKADWVATSALVVDTGIPRERLKGAMSALTRHLKAHYQREDWPMKHKWDAETGEMTYQLDPEHTTIWRSIRGI